jgi:hypothetical protein
VPFSTELTLHVRGEVRGRLDHPLAFAELEVVDGVTHAVSAPVSPALLGQPTNVDPTLDFVLAIPRHTGRRGLTLDGIIPIVPVTRCGDGDGDGDGDDHDQHHGGHCEDGHGGDR